MAYARTSDRAVKNALRERMRDLGLGHGKIAAELARRYRLRPRTAWREAHGWSLTDAARHINTRTSQAGLDPRGICAMSASHLCEYEQWPGQASKDTGRKPGGRRPSPYLLATLASVYGATVFDLIDLANREHLPPADLLVLEEYGRNQPARGHPSPARQPTAAAIQPTTQRHHEAHHPIAELQQATAADLTPHPAAAVLPALGDVAYRGGRPSWGSGSWIEREVVMTAHESSDHAERAEQREIGDATLEQLRADVVRLSREYMTGEPLALFLEMRRVRSRIHAALDRHLWPRDQRDLYFLLGCLNCLMATASMGLGYPQSAQELIRAAWAYATVIDHRPLMARLRLGASDIAYWHDRPQAARDLAASGLDYLSAGPYAALLHVQLASAAARLGQADTARQAISAAADAREHQPSDELLEIGGEFGFSVASQHYYAGRTLLEIPQAHDAAIRELEHALERYQAGPEPGEDHSHECVMLTHADLAAARLRAGQLEAALSAVEPVTSLSPGSRTSRLTQRLAAVRAELARPRYQGTAQARDLGERIEDFGRETIVAALHDLPGGPG